MKDGNNGKNNVSRKLNPLFFQKHKAYGLNRSKTSHMNFNGFLPHLSAKE